jgi:hypothetical protein
MTQINQNEYADFIVESLGVMVVEDKPALLDILQRNGSLVTDESSEAEILDASLKSIKDSKNFRQDIADYLSIALQSEDDGENSSFVNKKGEGWAKVGSSLKGLFAKKKDGSAFGNTLRNIFSKENIQTGVGIGMGYLGARLNSNATKSSNQQAIDYERVKAEASAQETKRLEAEGILAQMKSTVVGTDGKTKKWVLPVAIIGGVAVIGTILFFVLRKK